MEDAVWKAYGKRVDLEIYQSNALLLFALQMNFSIEDIHSAAGVSLTDGSNDKKCDLIHVDRDKQRAVIAQGYFSKDPTRAEAPANKASDLNTAASWALTAVTSSLPMSIKSAAIELRDAIKAGDVRSLEFWYVHNLPESENVEKELDGVVNSAKSMLLTYLAAPDIEVAALEVGRTTLADWYRGLTVPILVSEEFTTRIDAGFEISGDDWRAFVTAVPATWLRTVYRKHGKNLFSANVRDYLGSRNMDANINNGIKQSATDDPDHFWAFNNGITVLVHDYERATPKKLKLHGMSIVNGAQTTGALGSLKTAPNSAARVPARFVVSEKTGTIEGIIRYNNSQNQISPTDFRTNDQHQKRLVEEFKSIPDCSYAGGRRGGTEDVIKRPGDQIPSSSVGQALAAFHGDPVLAYNSKSKIWQIDTLYQRYFHERTTAGHMVFAFSLLKAIESRKAQLKEYQKADTPLTEAEHKLLGFLDQRGATKLLVAAVGACMEAFVGKPIPDKYSLSFGRLSPKKAQESWVPILTVVEALVPTLAVGVEDGLTTDSAKAAIATFAQLMNATVSMNHKIYEKFSTQLRA